MIYLVDAKRSPDPKVVAWLSAHEEDLAVDAVILGEIEIGIRTLPVGRKTDEARTLV